MIGAAYFQLRAQLGTALFSAHSLAAELDGSAERVTALQELAESLREPFILVVVGERGSGRSALLDALFGRELWKMESPGAREGIGIWKYADEARDVASEPDLVERWRPASFLRDFTVITSAGTHPLLAERFVPSADLVLVAVSAANLSAGSAWEFLKTLDKATLERAVFVLQHADARPAGEITAATEQFEKTLCARTGLTRPVFTVCAQAALEAKLSGGGLDGTGFDRLEAFIDAELTAREPRRARPREVVRRMRAILNELRGLVAEAASVIEQDEARRRGLSATLAERKEQSLRQIGGFLWALAQTYETAQKRGEELLVTQLTASATLKLIANRAFWRNDFHEEIERRLQEAVQRHIESSLHALEIDLRTVWQQFHEALEKGFPSGARIVATLPNFEQASTDLVPEIAAAVLEQEGPAPLEAQLGRMFATIALWLRVTLGLAVGAMTWALLATPAKAAHADLASTAAGFFILLGIALGVFGRRRIVGEFRRGMNEKREAVINAIEDHLRPAVNRFYKELDGAFTPLRSFCTEQRKLYASVLDRIAQIEATCRRCEAALGERASNG